MRGRAAALLFGLALAAGGTGAAANLEASPRPSPRDRGEGIAGPAERQAPGATAEAGRQDGAEGAAGIPAGEGGAIVDPAAAPALAARPTPRSSDAGSAAPQMPQAGGAVLLSPRPERRPENLRRRAAVRAAGFRPAPLPVPKTGARGTICGDPRLKGAAIQPIPARLPGCGLTGGVRVTEVSGLALSTPAAIDCRTATALANWVDRGVEPAVGARGGGAVRLRVAAHYACRTRNNRPGAKVSEHGRGRAIDIAAIGLRNGTRISVLTGWGDRTQGPILRAMHRAACGPFGTVLGPEADRYHRDHFHFDTARYRSGTYCR